MPVRDVKLGPGTAIAFPDLVNLYECTIGANCRIGPFVEIQRDVVIGDDCRIQSHSFLCSKLRIGNGVFVGHGVMFVNDRHPPRYEPEFWDEIVVEDGVAIGSNATILPVRIGAGALIGAGAVVTSDVPPNHVALGNPARSRPRPERG